MYGIAASRRAFRIYNGYMQAGFLASCDAEIHADFLANCCAYMHVRRLQCNGCRQAGGRVVWMLAWQRCRRTASRMCGISRRPTAHSPPHTHTYTCAQPPPTPQAKYLLTEAPLDVPIGPRFLAGATLWLVGCVINLQADHILINLRKPGETGGGGVGMAEGRRRWGTCMKELVGTLAAGARLCRVLLAPHIPPLQTQTARPHTQPPTSLPPPHPLPPRSTPALPRPAQATRSRAAACLSMSLQPTTLERWWSGRAGRWPPGRSRPPPLPSSHSPTWRPGGLLVVMNPPPFTV